jgi:hypothetical protein
MMNLIQVGILILVLAALPGLTFAQSSVHTVQQALNGQGYETGKVDGKFGKKTAAAIKLYQSDWQLEQTGEISDDLIARLNQTHPATKPRQQKAENQNCLFDNRFPQARETIRYVGECLSGKAVGNGKSEWKYYHLGKWYRSTYEGGWRDGKYHGRGAFLWPNGDRYEGDWNDNKRTGLGVFSWLNGDRYDGKFRDAKFHGKGVYLWANGNRYEGEFRDDKPHGYGVSTWANGVKMSGNWSRGCLSDDGKKQTIGTTNEACGF